MKRFFLKHNKTVTPQNLGEHLLEKQLAYIGKTINEVKDDPEWYSNNHITQKQYNEWKQYSIETIQKVYKLNARQAEVEFAILDLGYGLSVK